jgi:hypothetical protein
VQFQLQVIADEYGSAERRLHGLARAVPAERWGAQADGLPLTAVRVTSPFNPRARHNLYACFTILPRHQHRHLWQAERVWPEQATAV